MVVGVFRTIPVLLVHVGLHVADSVPEPVNHTGQWHRKSECSVSSAAAQAAVFYSLVPALQAAIGVYIGVPLQGDVNK